jgi:hypothetical protein
MKDHILQNAINIIRNLTEDSPTMSAGTGGFTGAADPKGPVAGFDPVMKNKIRRRLSSPPSLPLSNNKKK